MEITITDGHQTLLTIKGRLDTVNASQLEKAIAPILSGEMKNTVIDCTELDYISSSGLRQFLILQKKATADQVNLIIRGMQDEIKEIFNMTGFSALFLFE